MDPQLTALAVVASQELVKAMASEGWQLVRDRVAALLGRGDGQRVSRQVEQLEHGRTELRAGRVDERTSAGRWQGRLEALLEEHPELAGELSALAEELRRAGTGPSATASHHSVAAGGDVHLNATDGGVAAGVIHGSVSTGNPPPPARN